MARKHQKKKMSKFLQAVQNLPERVKSDWTEKDLNTWGLREIKLRSYQLAGVKWLSEGMGILEGCILGDEMGLGKTCQTISLLAYARGFLGMDGPFLVVSPLTVLENWKQELERFCPSLSVVCYTGNKEERAELQREINSKQFHVLLTTYELCLRDAQWLKRRNWKILVVDEAHRLKNQASKLHETLSEFSVDFRLLLTGTPIQNNLQEIYSLLTFIQPSLFPHDATEEFVSSYADVQTEDTLVKELHKVLQPFLLRRVKDEVEKKLPQKKELVVYHGMTALQKKHYKSILMKDTAAFEAHGKTRALHNILMELRKCVNHPYLIRGVEPYPYVVGEHVVEASGKLSLLDHMLAYLLEGGHRVLLFSQFTLMLDYLQEYAELRGYGYERLDGSVRGEERNLAIKNFKTKDTFIFLLSTKAGGVGLNLTAADTVIFVDSDFNPQNDLQAEARAHRIGQERAVKVIRLLGKDTVEEIIYSRAMSKLQLTNTVIEEGRFSLLENPKTAASAPELRDILTFGVDKLLSTETSSVQNVDLKLILGSSKDGCWLMDEEPVIPVEDDEEKAGPSHMYEFEGKDYSKTPSAKDREVLTCLFEEELALKMDLVNDGRTLRSKTGSFLAEPLATPSRKRTLTESQMEERRLKKEESIAKKAKIQEEKKRQREEEIYKNKMARWDLCGYKSLCLSSTDSEGEDVDEDGENSSVNSTDSEDTEIHYVIGDVTHPQTPRMDAIIVHCVDDSGRWGKGGLFTALEVRSDEAKKQYELAGNMEDLDIGHVLLFPIEDKQPTVNGRDHLALIVAQKRDKSNNVSGIQLTALEKGLKKIYRAAKKLKASVHLPRIGHSTKGFNWYGTERLIRKHLAHRGIPTFVYYYKQTPSQSTVEASSSQASTSLYYWRSHSPCDSAMESPESSISSPQGKGAPGLPDFMNGVHVYFYNIGDTDKKTLARYLIAYDGDVEDIMTSEVTHIVAEVESPNQIQELRHFNTQYPQAAVVRRKWLESCYANQRIVNSFKYNHKLK
ncbi:chromodomain-helicase-DNA-binding protein 1-like isoform X1 [Astyanax mexicanus]|uniref:chromodomain-helicase-DNA-binding protein 1-like isoform X1 n=2 Tax=Astyanax mexicanus TaxID=7994 RepID=UPI0020CAEF1D|nr:chromodomain-helicase-DNA-binding protein 1-like isoform X1 [Astyanax mexicanus]